MDVLRDLDLVRAMPSHVEFRDDSPTEGSLGMLEVAFSRFNVWYPIASYIEGDFMERTLPGAFSKTISQDSNSVKVLFNHGQDPQIGNKVLSVPDSLREEKDGPVGVGSLLDTSYNRDLLPGLKAGAYGSSFRFQVIQDEWNDEPGTSSHNPKGLPERSIKEIRLFEFGPVTFPANPGSTSKMRSMTDHYYEALRADNPQRFDELVSRARSLRTPGDSGAAPQETTEPDDHSEANDDATRAAAASARHRALQLAGVIS